MLHVLYYSVLDCTVLFRVSMLHVFFLACRPGEWVGAFLQTVAQRIEFYTLNSNEFEVWMALQVQHCKQTRVSWFLVDN